MKMGFSKVFFILLPGICFCIEFKIFDDILQVKSQNGLFFPLCSNSFSQLYGEQACSSVRSSFSSYTVIPMQQYTYSVGCTSEVCFSFLSSFCKTGVKVHCTTSLCSAGTHQVGSKCLYISDSIAQDYSTATSICKPFKMVSSLRQSDIEVINETLLHSLPSTPIYTSALRKGSKWQWENGETLDNDFSGDGRCLGLESGALRAIDCESEGYVLCEKGRECVSKNNEYDGTTNVTSNGLPCIRWDDPTILFQRDQPYDILPHNYCRIIQKNSSSIPVCYVAPNQLKQCSIPICPESFNDAINKDSTCPTGSFSCDNDSKCISEKFQCDYEIDCSDGTDEHNCEDYLQNYELVGAYRLVKNIIEVWTYIPHVQGCAQKCRQSLLMCEAFSYETKTQTCLLTDTSQTYSSLAPKITSLYYRRRFSSKDVVVTTQNTTLYATKNSKKGIVCNENYSREKLTSICRIFGFGDAIFSSSSHQSDAASAQHSSKSQIESHFVERSNNQKRQQNSTNRDDSSLPNRSSILPPHQPAWSLSCLREPNCTKTQISTCNTIRCSNCPEAVCSDGSCINFSQLCDGINDCSSGDDENECHVSSFRLANGTDTSGYVEILFRNQWEPVCNNIYLSTSQLNSICDTMLLGNTARILQSTRYLNNGWQLNCSDTCDIRRTSSCRNQLKISCRSRSGGLSSSSQCGIRYVEVNARDAARSRIARVVGGFETVPGAFPWTAALRIRKTGAHHCGASILDRTHLITAAHCFEDDERVSSYEIVVGDWDNNQTDGTEQFFDLERIYFYPIYKDIFAHDIAILEIPIPGIRFDHSVQPICLPSRDFVYTPGQQCVVSGWGSMGLKYANRLQAALIPIIDRSDCVNSSEIYQSMSRSAFCAGYLEGGIDSCQGDSGGPFACRRDDGSFVLAGVISWGDGCAQKKQPGIYTMVAPYLSWINSVINKDNMVL